MQVKPWTQGDQGVFNIRISTSPTSLNQVDGYLKIFSLVVGANFG
jgi:hypothetical protein